MYKLDRKLLISLIAVISTIFIVSCNNNDGDMSYKSQADISGGVSYPIIGDKTGPYKVNINAIGRNINHGRIPTANELKAWDVDVMPDGTGLPEGEGSVEDGEILYEAQCVSCHGDFGSGGGGYPALSKGNAYDLHKTLTNNRDKDPEADGPVRVFGSYWPQASTLWWYIRDGMPHTKSKTLTNNEVYALSAYILSINEMKIDGEEVGDDYVLNREKFLKIKMPNRDGFIPKIDGKDGLKNTRAFYTNPSNFGGIKINPSDRCMSDCQKKTAKISRIVGVGISDFHPPISTSRSLAGAKKSHKKLDTKQAYTDNCAMCHSNGVAPDVGDKSGWKPYLKKGIKKVYINGIKGTKGGMPAKGGSSLSDKDFKKVVDYMVKFK
jgi:cytochrome c